MSQIENFVQLLERSQSNVTLVPILSTDSSLVGMTFLAAHSGGSSVLGNVRTGHEMWFKAKSVKMIWSLGFILPLSMT